MPQERASQYLAYQNADTVDCKGLFVLDKLHGRPREEILEQARVSLTSALRSGRCVVATAVAHSNLAVPTTQILSEYVDEQYRFIQRLNVRARRWLHLELGKSAPSFGDVDDRQHFPAQELCSRGFGTLYI